MFIHLHLLITTVTHCISLVFILSAAETGTVLQHNHSARATTDYYAGHVFSLMFCDLSLVFIKVEKDSPTHSPGLPGVLTLGQGDDMCIIVN